ncbi:META domain-containing protein [Streptomyces sp. TLI_55]|uniref:META domain-containing protein n=1 Tax=Streptomyces sp. TLI_55 TaxID=1938861 RepID=UPI0015CF027F|nr:META domain-containing protein [Streptomyces sp. TLI_55]
MKRTFLLASTAVATAALSTTSVARADNAGPRTPPPVLTGVAWHAQSITENGVTHTVPEGSRAGLTFDADQRTGTGHDGCNGFSGAAVVDAGRSTVTRRG